MGGTIAVVLSDGGYGRRHAMDSGGVSRLTGLVALGAAALAPGASAMQVTSPVLRNGAAMPARYTCDGVDVSPPLRWTGVPRGTGSFALVVDDPDAPGGTFTHWLVWNVPASARSLPAAVSASRYVQGRNGFGRIAYGGPCPPAGSTHHYRFTLYAVAGRLALRAGSSRTALLAALHGRTRALARVTPTYER
jgi:Raf kinase inhibitor-like YbhB/YbcL family protein